jgi:hypothetical protein
MADVISTFRQGGRERRLIYHRVSNALYSAVLDLHEHRAELVAIAWGTRRLYDRAAIERVWAACRDELIAAPWKVPASLDAAGCRELRPPEAP